MSSFFGPTISGKRARSAESKEAEALLAQAIAIATAQGAHLLALRATVDLARLWLAADRGDEARRRLAQALAALDPTCNDIDVREARELIDAAR